MSLRNTQNSYGAVTRALHWLVALLVIIMLIIGLSLDIIHNPLVTLAHKLTGLVILTLAIIMVIWNFINVKPDYPPSVPRWQQIIAKSVQHLMLLAIILMPLSGWFFSTAAGKAPAIGTLHLAMPFVPANNTLVHYGVAIHNFIAFVLIGLVIIHTLAALTHHFVLKDNILKRMIKE